MAESIVNETPATSEAPRDAMDITDEIDKKLVQASAISALMSLYPEQSDSVPDITLTNAAWAVRDLLKEAGELVDDLNRSWGHAAPREVA